MVRMWLPSRICDIWDEWSDTVRNLDFTPCNGECKSFEKGRAVMALVSTFRFNHPFVS